jgi:site-specific DNA-methyltransferase (adenine-specific)
VWTERQVKSKEYPHIKPYGLIKRLIEATSTINNLVVDPAAGSYVVLDACWDTGRTFLGCDITGE